MIVSRHHSFVFAAVPKTGTHSVRQALRAHLGPDDLEQVKLYVDKSFPWPELAALGHGHVSLRQLQMVLPAEEFAGLFKFAFVRNPFDRFVSFCAFMTRETDFFQRDPRAVMRHLLFVAPPVNHIVFQPQHQFVAGDDGDLLSDMIGRVEQMQQSYDEICARIGIPSTELGRANASQHDEYRGYYDQQLIDGVARLYRRDLELFGYDF